MSTHDEYTHLFGDVYWQTGIGVGIVGLAAMLTAFVPFETWVDMAPGLMRSAYEANPDGYIWLARNYTTVPIVLFGATVGLGLSFSPDVDDVDETN